MARVSFVDDGLSSCSLTSLASRIHRWRKILVPFRKCVGAVQPSKSTTVSRRCICERVIWRKPLAFAADAEGYKYIVWGFIGRFAILSPEPCQPPSSMRRKVLAQQHVTTGCQRKSCFKKTAAPRTRGSVRRASGFVQIPIALKSPSVGNLSVNASGARVPL